LVEGLKIYGGFPADANDTDHTSIQTRGLAPLYDPLLNATILSGDPNSGEYGNAYHVVIGVDIPDGETVLDGFTITGGSASSSTSNSRHYIVVNGKNIYSDEGGGIYNIYSSPTLTNLIISGNRASYQGGGIYNQSSSPTLTNVTISENRVNISGLGIGGPLPCFGGGIYNQSSSPTLTNVTISGNTAFSYGGGIYNSSSSPMLTNVTISGNTAIENGGGGICNSSSSPTLTNVTISGNTAHGFYGGGGICNLASSPTLTNVIISENDGSGMSNHLSSSPTLTNVTISGNTAGEGGGIQNDSSSPKLTNVTISGNTATRGGGIYNDHSSSPKLTNLTISGNTATDGGGIFNSSSSPTLTNVIISGNTASYGGGGIANYFNSSLTLTNVTISGNTAGGNGGGIYNNYHSSLKLTNSIVWGNNAFNGSNVDNGSSQISTPTYNYSLVQGIDLTTTGTGNFNGTLPANAPLFVLPALASAAPTTTGNYRLLSVSPLIDKGDNESYTTASGRVLLSDVDIDGNPRLYGASIDLGAYEYEPVSGSILLYVKQNSTGTGDGSSWANAYPELADALLAAKTNANIKVIWVAASTYKPLHAADGTSTVPNDKAFVLVKGVKIYGGFPADANDIDHTSIHTRGQAPLYDP
jgi:predicted outer membrane repeat protein